MQMAALPSSLAMPRPPARVLSSLRALTGPERFSFPTTLTTGTADLRSTSFTIRMGGGPRTYPGGVSKWQWKRMQAKKAKQLLKARLCRERQIYEMRKRTELKAAVSELERPWEVVERAPTLFSVRADEQVKVLADRFQKPGGYDLWSDKDGPQVFRPNDGFPSSRFFPKGVVHSVKPYGVVADTPDSAGSGDFEEERRELQFDDWIARGKGGVRRTRRSSNRRSRIRSEEEGDSDSGAGFSGGHDHEVLDEMLLGNNGNVGDFIRGRKGPSHSKSINSKAPSGFVDKEGNAVRRRNVSGENVRGDFSRGRRVSAHSSSDGISRNSWSGRQRSENAYGSDSESYSNGTVSGRVQRGRRTTTRGSNQDKVASGRRRFGTGKHSYQATSSQIRDADQRSFQWREEEDE